MRVSMMMNGMYLFPFEGVWLGGLLGQRVVIAD